MTAPAESVEVKTPFFSGKVSSANLSTIFMGCTLLVVCLTGYALIVHAADTKEVSSKVAADLVTGNKAVADALRDSNKDVAAALKEQTQAIRENTCVITLPQDRREQNSDICKRISR